MYFCLRLSTSECWTRKVPFSGELSQLFKGWFFPNKTLQHFYVNLVFVKGPALTAQGTEALNSFIHRPWAVQTAQTHRQGWLHSHVFFTAQTWSAVVDKRSIWSLMLFSHSVFIWDCHRAAVWFQLWRGFVVWTLAHYLPLHKVYNSFYQVVVFFYCSSETSWICVNNL